MNKYFTDNAILSIFSKNYMELKRGLPIRPSEMGYSISSQKLLVPIHQLCLLNFWGYQNR